MNHPRILVVDDDEAILDSLRRALELEAYHVMTAVDGASALRSVAESEPDAVVLDIGLPDLNGRVVAARMRAGGLATPILVLSAMDAVDDRIAGLEAGADDYLVKPFAVGSSWRGFGHCCGVPLRNRRRPAPRSSHRCGSGCCWSTRRVRRPAGTVMIWV
jgi:CheY-like chemotaxis protein